MTGLVKGIGFGAVLALSVVAGLLLWQGDLVSVRRLCLPAGWALAVAMTLLWPVLMVARHGYGGASALDNARVASASALTWPRFLCWRVMV